jgi:hypothetical protein
MFIELQGSFRTLGEIISWDENEVCKSCIAESKWENSADPDKPVYIENLIQNRLSGDQIDAAILGTFQ